MSSTATLGRLCKHLCNFEKLGISTLRRSLLTPSSEIPYKTSAEVIQALSLNVIGQLISMSIIEQPIMNNELFFNI